MQYLFTRVFEMGINRGGVHSEWCSSHIAIQCVVAVMQKPCTIIFTLYTHTHYVPMPHALLTKAVIYFKVHIVLTQMGICECTQNSTG